MRSPRRVLVVEDDASIRDLLGQALSEAGYRVSAVNSGAAAIEAMRQHAPDLLLLDLMMPDMNGWDLLRSMAQVRALAAVPVLVVSAADSEGLRRAQDLGAPVFLPKPFDLDDLLQAVERLSTRPIRQCAWCRLVATPDGDFELPTGRTLPWATHGVCPRCKHHQMERILGETA